MRSVQEIYDAYRIMPTLQMHQLRVAAVGKTICDRFAGEIDTNVVVLACLFHDMGNIIKSDLVTFPEFVEPEGYDYWKGVKDEFVAKYGVDEHHATVEIAVEIGLAKDAIELIRGLGFSVMKTIRDHGPYEQKIVASSDSRVGPYGILSIDDRYEEARRRYQSLNHPDVPAERDRFDELADAGREIERQIFAQCSIEPEDINDESAAPLIEELRNYPVA